MLKAIETIADRFGEGIGEAFDRIRDAADADGFDATGSNLWAGMKAVGRPTAVVVLVVGLLYLGYRAFLRFREAFAVGLPFAVLWFFMDYATATGAVFMKAAIASLGILAVLYTIIGKERLKMLVLYGSPVLLVLAAIRAWRPEVLLWPGLWLAIAIATPFFGSLFIRCHDQIKLETR